MKNNRGLTIIEIIIVLSLIGIAIPSLLAAFGRTVVTGGEVKNVAIATNLAEEQMELRVTHEEFVNITSVGPVDLTGDFSDYNYELVVDYVNAADLDTPVGVETDFKRVQVIITNDNVADFNITLATAVSNLDDD